MSTNNVSLGATRLAQMLARTKTRIVFAESCTCGLLAATLGEVPGISQWLCGSAVVYQESTKSAWLDVSPEMIERCGVVSEDVARAMAVGVLGTTPHADVAVSVTGHLGPNAPAELDGVVHAAIAFRSANDIEIACRMLQLRNETESDGMAVRLERRLRTTSFLLEWTAEFLAVRSQLAG